MTTGPLNGNARIFRFGAFEVDMRSSEVRKQGVRIRVQGQPLKVLVMLLERPGDVVTREELRQQLWPDKTFVDFEHGLNSALTRLRQALADSADTPRYIETLPRQGYRFIAQVVQDSGEARALPPAAKDAIAAMPEPRLPGTLRLGIVFGALAIGVFGVLVAWRLSTRREPPRVLEQLTHDLGLSTDPAISPDGKLLAYASDRNGGHLNIWLRQISTAGNGVQLTHFDADTHQPAFSPDGSRIAFCSDGNRGGIYVVAAIGGEPVRIADFGRDPRFSPDGNWIAFWVAADAGQTSGGVSNGAVYVVPASGGSPRRVGLEFAGHPVWASDSQRLLVSKMTPDLAPDWLVIPVNGSPVVSAGVYPILKGQGFALEMGTPLPLPAAWSRDYVFFSAKTGDTVNTWRIRLPQQNPRANSPAEQLTFGTGSDVSPSLSGDQLVFASLTQHTAIWSLPMEANRMKVTGNLQRLTESTAPEVTPGTTVEGRYVAYTSDRAKGHHVFIKDLETGKEIALAATADREWHPIVSRDGSRVAYTNRGDKQGIYIVPVSGGAAERVGDGNGFIWSWSLDNQRLLFRKDHRTSDIWLLDLSSKSESVFLHREGMSLFQAKFSPDDQWVAIEAVRTQGDSRLYVVPLKNGMPAATQSWIPIVDEDAWADKPRWSPDGNTLYFISQRDGFRCVWAQRLNAGTKHPSGPAVAAQHFHSVSLSLANVPMSFLEIDVARNRLLLTLGELTGNIWRSRIPAHDPN